MVGTIIYFGFIYLKASTKTDFYIISLYQCAPDTNHLKKDTCAERGMIMKYTTKGVCSRSIEFDVVNNKVTGVKFEGGCSGNTQGVAALVEGMDVNEAIKRMKGIKCGFKPTSCPDQLATALEQYLAKAN